MAQEHDEGTVTLEKETGVNEVKPLDLDQLIMKAVGGEEESPESGDNPEAEEGTGLEQAPEEAEAQESDSEEQAELEGESGEKSDGHPEWFNRRIGKEVRKRKELEENLQTRDEDIKDLQSEVEMLRGQADQAAAPAEGENPLNAVDSMQKLEHEQKLSHQRMDFVDSVEEMLDDGDIDGALKQLEAQEVKLDSDPDDYGWEEGAEKEARKVLKRVRNHARKSLDVWIPQRANFLSYKDKAGKVAHERYTWLGNPDSEEMAVFNEAVKNVPLFKAFPDYELQVARYVRGTMLEMKEHGEPGKKSAKKSARKIAPTRAEPKQTMAPAASDDEKASRYRASRDQVFAKGDHDSLDNYIGSLLENQLK